MASRGAVPAPARLHVDRAFTIRGAGTVVTGTLWAGSIAPGDELILLPAERAVRVRGVQVHDAAVERAPAGQRVAVNLTGVRRDEVERGDVLAAAAAKLTPSFRIDAELALPERDPEHGERVQVHHGTRESAARVTWLGGRFWQLRLESPLLAQRDDRLVIRQIAPPYTLGGGRVLDPSAKRHGPSRDLLGRLERLAHGVREGEPQNAQGHPQEANLPPAPAAIPLRPSALALEARLREAGTEPPLDSELDAEDLRALRDAGRAVRVSRSLHYERGALDAVERRLIAVAEREGGAITLAQLRDELGTSRKFAQALLEHFDSERVTIRRGDEHVLRRSRR